MNRISVTLDRVTFSGFIQWMNKRGYSMDEIAGNTGLEIARIRDLLEDSGIPIGELYAKVSEETIRDAMTDYSNGMKPIEILNKYGYSIHEFRDICSLRNIPNYEELDPTGKLFRQKRAWSLRRGGKKYGEIQEELGLGSKQAVGSLIKGYDAHLAKVQAKLNTKTVDGLYAQAVLEKISECFDSDPDTAVSHIRELIGKDEA